ARARDTGAQKWLREPDSLNASVVRCRPADISFRVSSTAAAGRAEAIVALAHQCIRNTIATDASASAKFALTADSVRGPKPEPPTAAGSVIPNSPARLIESIASAEKLPALSCRAAFAANTPSAISLLLETAVSWFMSPSQSYRVDHLTSIR